MDGDIVERLNKIVNDIHLLGEPWYGKTELLKEAIAEIECLRAISGPTKVEPSITAVRIKIKTA